MTPRLIGAAVLALVCAGTAADARPLTHRTAYACQYDNSARVVCHGQEKRILSHRRAFDANGNDVRPRAWCGWWLRHHLGVADRAGNRAAWWARYGTNAHGPAVGAIVVWRHHVGVITGQTSSGYVVLSGNDGHRVRERERSLRGAIAFRWPNGVASR
jgi:hypothetical protein